MPAVTWTADAKADLDKLLYCLLTDELSQVFADAKQVVVARRFRGYSRVDDAKVILGVEVQWPDRTEETCVVKIGRRDLVERDFENWNRCLAGKPFASRILVSIVGDKVHDLIDRAAVIYQDAHALYAGTSGAQACRSPRPLEEVVRTAVLHDDPEATSVERVLRHIFSDSHRCLYRYAKPDARAAYRFYGRRLRGQPPAGLNPAARSAWQKWDRERWRVEMRRDLIWLFCGREEPDTTEPAVYLDPYDYARWAFRTRNVPETVVGRSHGDLHGRNILVGVERGEAEYPAVYDYGDMRDNNVLAWDFVKLELELKVRLLGELYQDDEVQKALLEPAAGEPSPAYRLAIRPGPQDERTLLIHQAAFAFAFESRLDRLTDSIQSASDPSAPDVPGVHPPDRRELSTSNRLDRALAVLLRIRQEAALCLGDRQPSRTDRGGWRAEYYFAVMVYGLNVAKFNTYETPVSLTNFALVSAGVAAAELARMFNQHPPHPPYPPLSKGGPGGSSPHPSYRVPLYHARKLRHRQHRGDAVTMLEAGRARYAHAVPYLLEYGLGLTDLGRHEDAAELLDPLADLCRVFRDHETLCRLGAAFKKWGDTILQNDPTPFEALAKHPAREFYNASYVRYTEAYELAEDAEKHYPGVNAATLAWLLGKRDEAARVAADVQVFAGRVDLGRLSKPNQFWLLASRGEAALVQHDPEQAADHYRIALANLPDGHDWMPQVAYAQLCRLWWALGDKVVDPVARVFFDSGLELPRGPLGDCGRV